MCDCAAEDFSATARSEGDVRRLLVEGTCTCPTSGFTLTLEPDNPGIVPQPQDVVLRLRETSPDVGADVLTPTPASYEAEISLEAVRVVIRRSGAEPLTVPIVEAEDADDYGSSY